jgi:hypothetical protein
MREICKVCGNYIQVQIQKNTGLCSQRCEKAAEKINIKSISE